MYFTCLIFHAHFTVRERTAVVRFWTDQTKAFAINRPFHAEMACLVIGNALVVITLLTISYQALKAAGMNPAKSLRSD